MRGGRERQIDRAGYRARNVLGGVPCAFLAYSGRFSVP